MAGNVWEWTSSVSGDNRIVRGGSWYNADYYCDVSHRSSYGPSGTAGTVGFRVCRDSAPIIPMTWVSIDDPGVSGHESFTGEMSKYETTNAQYCQFLNDALASGDISVGSDNVVRGANGLNSGVDFATHDYFDTSNNTSYSQITWTGTNFIVRSREGYDMSDHPVVEVSWYGATAFANYYGWRLPSKWGWQAVADYDGSYVYGCGTTIDNGKFKYDFFNPLGLTSEPFTSPVDHYPSYGYGLNDMAGNVSEWTSATYSRGNYIHVGGGMSSNESGCSVSAIHYTYDWLTTYYIGFRVCR